ncbi:MAG: macro domain-containing protein [Cyclobacteriaceae bacterium]
MLQFVKGNLLNAEAEALVNTVNTVGVMGKGIALQFKNRYPENYKIYRDACKSGTFHTGEILAVKDGNLMNQKWILNFPTKAHWKGNSRYEYISSGLKALRQTLQEKNIKSVAIPPLGCGNGGLEWSKVKPMIRQSLEDLDITAFVYEPNEQIKSMLQKEEAPKEVKLTPARAMLLYLLFQYEAMGEQSSLFVANKLAYFLQRSGENLRLKFEAHHYGPYAVQLNHVLLHLNGVYLKGMEQNKVEPYETLSLNYQKLDEIKKYVSRELNPEQQARLNQVLKLLRGFESSFSIELLATVDYLISSSQKRDVESVLSGIDQWSIRKSDLFKPKYVEVAFEHLKNHAQVVMS